MSEKGVVSSVKTFMEYISPRKVLIADQNSGSRSTFAKILTSMGAKPENLIMAGTMDQAEAEVAKHKPHVIIADYMIGKRCGLDLLQQQRKQNPEESKQCLFIMVTSNTSQSVVAQAVEEDVDTYVLKPFTSDILRQAILKAAVNKVNPSTYIKTIEEGKKLLFSGKTQESMPLFEKAMNLDNRPALAYYYHGQALALQKSIDEAQADYLKGLNHNKIHYRCLTGLYEILMEKKLYKEAYELVKRISRYYPANASRLNSVLRLAVMTSSYEDIERYYQIFINLDERNEEMIKYICAALVICGKYYLARSLHSRAVDLFEKSASVASGRTKILREIVTALVNADLLKDAQQFLSKFPADALQGADFLTTDLIISEKLLSPELLTEKGKKILTKNAHDPQIYKILIKAALTANQNEHAAQLVADGSKRWPDISRELQSITAEKPKDGEGETNAEKPAAEEKKEEPPKAA